MSRLLSRLFAQASPLESLAKAPTGLPSAQPFPEVQPAVQVSTLANGLKVATFGPVPYPGTTVGVFVNAGARYQTPANEGSVNVLRRLIFKVRQYSSVRHLLPLLWHTFTCFLYRETRSATK
jgi:predicted Zn-dependent peptidase